MRILTLFEMKKSNSWDFVMLNLFQHLFETLKQVQGDVSKISLYSNFVLLNSNFGLFSFYYYGHFKHG